MRSIYRSGYVGVGLSPLNRPDSKAELESSDGIMHKLTLLTTGQDFPISKDLDSLYNDYVSKPYQTKRFRFQAQVYKAAIRVCAFKRLNQWVLDQTRSPFLSDAHKDFLFDTLQYINTGTRRMSLSAWRITIQASRTHLSGRAPSKLTAHEAGILHQANLDWSGTMMLWLSHVNGFEDFFQTMWIMYGSGIEA